MKKILLIIMGLAWLLLLNEFHQGFPAGISDIMRRLFLFVMAFGLLVYFLWGWLKKLVLGDTVVEKIKNRDKR